MSSPFLKQVFNKDRTFRPKRKFEPGTQRFELHKKAQASLNAGLDLKLAVQLPAGEDLHDWVAVHVVDFFNRVNLIYGTISDGCTEQSCPVMSGGPKYEYRWQDEHRFRKPTALSAPRYMDLLMDWIEAQINNEELFPTSVGESGRRAAGAQAVRPLLARTGWQHLPPSQGCAAVPLSLSRAFHHPTKQPHAPPQPPTHAHPHSACAHARSARVASVEPHAVWPVCRRLSRSVTCPGSVPGRANVRASPLSTAKRRSPHPVWTGRGFLQVKAPLRQEIVLGYADGP